VIADDYDAFLLDLDGVLYRGDQPIPHAPEAVARLRALGKRLAFVTNNSSRTPDAVATHLASVGVDADPSEVETSSLTTATVLHDRSVRRAAVIGEEGLRAALASAGVEVVPTDADPDVMVLGWDRHVTYDDLRDASLAVQRGATLLATNDDVSYPAPGGFTWPGAGAILAALETATGLQAEVFGKPNPPILHAALARAGGGRPLVVGDRLETDIDGAANAGWDAALVLTGISTRDEAAAAPRPPAYVLDDLSGLFD
jgi:HAD superfamily hydrolase (TIGR01457 family)